MTANFLLSNTVVSGAFDQTFKDELTNYINNYITNKY